MKNFQIPFFSICCYCKTTVINKEGQARQFTHLKFCMPINRAFEGIIALYFWSFSLLLIDTLRPNFVIWWAKIIKNITIHLEGLSASIDARRIHTTKYRYQPVHQQFLGRYHCILFFKADFPCCQRT